MRNVSHREAAGVLLWAALVIILAGAPYVVAVGWAGADQQFSGFLWGVDEGNVYLSWIRQYSDGAWFAANQFTTRYQRPHFLNLFLLSLGRMCHYLHLRPIEAFHLARLAGIPFVLYAFYCLVAHLTALRAVRISALLLASLGSGFGWVFTLLSYLGGRPSFLPMDCANGWQVMPEAVTYLTFVLNPLFTWSIGLLCLTLLWAWRALERRSVAQAALAGLLLLLLGNVHSYDVFAAQAAILLWVLYLIARRELSLAAAARLYGVIFLLGLPSVVWAWYTAHADPAYMMKVNTPTLSPRIVDYAAGYGLLGVAALMGAYTAWVLRPRHPRSWAVVGWAAATLLLVYVPVSFQRKMIEGLHLALSYLAALAVAFGLPWLAEARWSRHLSANDRHRRRSGLVRVLVTAAVLLSLPSNVVFVYDTLQHVSVNYADLRHVLAPPVYLTTDEVRALQWLARRTTFDDIVLCSSLLGNHVPAWCRARVFSGHWAETLDFARTTHTVAAFYAPGLLPEARERIITDTGATFVIWGEYEAQLQRAMLGPAERAVGGPVHYPDPPDRDLPILTPAFASGATVIYRVAR